MRKIWIIILLFTLTACEENVEAPTLFSDANEVTGDDGCVIAYGPRYISLPDLDELSYDELSELKKEYEALLSETTLLLTNYRYDHFTREIEDDISNIESALLEIEKELN